MTSPDPDAFARRLAAHGSTDDPTAWFEQLYAAAADGQAQIPWNRGVAHPLFIEWIEHNRAAVAGRAVVVGAGPGFDAELLSAQGFDTVAFDVSPTAIELARERNAGSRVDYQVADLLTLPADWRGAFDLVVEIFTVQSLPGRIRDEAVAAVSSLVAPGGTLVVIAAARDEEELPDGPPWPLSRTEIEGFASSGLALGEAELRPVPQTPGSQRWRAVFTRPHV